MIKPKLCKDCKWSTRGLMFCSSIAKCKAPSLMVISLVTGKKTPRYVFCSTNRIGMSTSENCGRDGYYWEAK
jgi:hypothetical protein